MFIKKNWCFKFLAVFCQYLTCKRRIWPIGRLSICKVTIRIRHMAARWRNFLVLWAWFDAQHSYEWREEPTNAKRSSSGPIVYVCTCTILHMHNPPSVSELLLRLTVMINWQKRKCQFSLANRIPLPVRLCISHDFLLLWLCDCS